MKTVLIIFVTLVIMIQCKYVPSDMPFTNPLVTVYPCLDTTDIILSYDPGLAPKDRNQYYLQYEHRTLPINVSVVAQFSADVNIILNLRTTNNTFTRYSLKSGSRMSHEFVTSNPELMIYGYKVKGTVRGRIPYLTSFKINGVETCNQPNMTLLDDYAANTMDDETRLNCGRRKVGHTELIVNGAQTKQGDWPWHAALYKFEFPNKKYICGGTLLSKHFVLTAGHCVTEKRDPAPVLPEILTVVLGKYYFTGSDVESVERQVHKVIIHEDFLYRPLRNDIALLKLRTEVMFTTYIQPACLWYNRASEKLLSDEIIGTVVGWGFNINNSFTPVMQQMQMPLVSNSVCMSSHSYYNTIVNEHNFCAGYRNHSSPCNGDSGGAFQVFIPDLALPTMDTSTPGSWLVRGIVSVAKSRSDAALCDPDEYVVFTDVATYLTWIKEKMDYEVY
ncbi:clotting factor C-like [Bicyclus anynana]|uniref:Clotting factor C-like n=1 Tax=Bicyclus anynana TaxID=110368 RepID=A0A6J1NKI1_BICAN|nr:clotting factor C-like [Bicyclus anynana]